MAAQAKRKKHDKKSRVVRRSSEDRRAEAVTVAWMLCALTTAGSLAIAGLAYALVPAPAADNATSGPLTAVLPLMLFIAAVTSLVLLCLTPLVYLFRRVPPPKIITAIVMVVGLLPWIALATLAMTRV